MTENEVSICVNSLKNSNHNITVLEIGTKNYVWKNINRTNNCVVHKLKIMENRGKARKNTCDTPFDPDWCLQKILKQFLTHKKMQKL